MLSTSDDDSPSNNNTPSKTYTSTICIVPPPSYTNAWSRLTRARTELRDPGLFRWPPHVNLLYPFVSLQSTDLHTTLDTLSQALQTFEPFEVKLDRLGCFGGKHRGVLWMYPTSPNDVVIQLQQALQDSFPFCREQQKQGRFSPHLTLSHFESLDSAMEAKTSIEEWWDADTAFVVENVYWLTRKGDDDQFQIRAEIFLGDGAGFESYDPPKRFECMPLVEEPWVREERMKMKERRNGNSRRRRGKGRKPRNKGINGERRSRRTRDTPEVIAQKRAERKEKRERLAELEEIEEALREAGLTEN